MAATKLLKLEFSGKTDQGNHNFRVYVHPALLDQNSRLNDCLSLHFGNFRIGNSQSTPSMTKHRIELMEILNPLFDSGERNPELLGQVPLGCSIMRKEFVQGWVKQTNGGWFSGQSLEDALKITPLVRQ